MLARVCSRRVLGASSISARAVLVGFALFAFGLTRVASAQPTARLTTADGVFTAAQAKSGGELYTMLCQSCHAAITHTGTPFRSKWVGRTLGDLYTYIREEMPKTEPGSLSEEEYTLVLAYILRMNGMPTGRRALTASDASMARIRIDLPLGDSDGATRLHESASAPPRRHP
jgi:mono/diheme cytochrome c family protein